MTRLEREKSDTQIQSKSLVEQFLSEQKDDKLRKALEAEDFLPNKHDIVSDLFGSNSLQRCFTFQTE